MVLSGKWIIVRNIRLSEVSQTPTLIACFMHMWNIDYFYRRYNPRTKNTEKRGKTKGGMRKRGLSQLNMIK